jgi:hypothetical protein
MPIITRIARSAAVALIMFFSVRALGFSPNQALIAMLPPLLLGALNVAAGLTFSVTALVMALAVAAHLLPEQAATLKGAWRAVDQALAEVGHRDAASSATAETPATSVPATDSTKETSATAE